MKLSINHTTRHKYADSVSLGEHRLYLRPFEGQQRRVADFLVTITPDAQQRWVYDAHGNAVLCCNFNFNRSDELVITAHIVVEQYDENPFDFILDSSAVSYPFNYGENDQRALQAFLCSKVPKGEIDVLNWFYHAVSQPVQHPDVVQFLLELCEAIRRDIGYITRHEEGVQSPDETLKLKTGSCRDMAALFMSAVRQQGLAARFVSGYLYDPPSDNPEGHLFNRAVGSMHAWVEVYLPGAGWKGFDPTNGILANQNFVPCAISHDPLLINPIQGAFFAQQTVESQMDVALSIERVADSSY